MHKKNWLCLILSLVMVMGMLGCICPVAVMGAPIQARDPEKPLNILFIGNSFTHYNSMPAEIFAPLCDAAGYDVSVDAIVKGGHYLYLFAQESDEYGAKVKKALQEKSYDVVILQEQSGCPVSNAPLFYYGSRALAQMVKDHGAELWYYQTWGYKEGYSKLPTHGGTTAAMEMKLRAAYTAIAEETGGSVAHAGLAMLKVHQSHGSQINLYNSDLYHPSLYGSTLAAYTLFAEIFGVDVRDVNFDGNVGAVNAAILKQAAYEATFGDNEVPEEHRVVSEGVTMGQNGNSSNIDNSKTIQPTSWPTSPLISVVVDPSKTVGNGWVAPLKGDATKIFSGIRGDNDRIASLEYDATQLTDQQKQAIADIGNGVSIIGVQKMNSEMKGYTTAVENLVNGHWGSSYMAAMIFGEERYDVDGSVTEEGEFSALITLNFGGYYTFDTIGYMSGSMQGFPQIQKVYVSDDGEHWKIVESACFDTVKLAGANQELKNLASAYQLPDPWNQNKAAAQALFSMGGVTGKYIRIGIIAGRVPTTGGSSLTINLDGIQDLNTREIVVFGEKNPAADPNAHVWDTEYTIDLLPTCGTDGQKSIHCSHCEEIKEGSAIVLPATNEHDWDDSRYGRNGEKHFRFCNNCDAMGEYASHTSGALIVDTPATCVSVGKGHAECTVCTYEVDKDVVIPTDANAHTGVNTIRNAIPATCDKEGYTGDTVCECGTTIAKGTVTPATGKHSWDQGKVTTEPTTAKEGIKTFTCTTCKSTKTEKLAKLAPKVSFTDVKKSDFYYTAVQWAVALGITTGTSKTTFSPSESCTRGQIATFLWRAAGQPTPSASKNPFDDVRKSDYYYKAVLWAVNSGITTGTGKTTFSPNDPCTRGQIAAFLWRANGSQKVSVANPFTDVKSKDYFYNAVLWAVKNKITAGTTATTFEPNSPCTRGQIVTFLYRAYN